MTSLPSTVGPAVSPGKIILLNGASSSGKSALAAALQAELEQPFWHYSIDHILAARVLPQDRIDKGEFPWQKLRPQFFAGFHASLPALAGAGNNLIVEHIVESEAWMNRLLGLLHNFDVFFVGLHCPLEELERREIARGNRRIGEARLDFDTTHKLCSYDLEVETTNPIGQTVASIVNGWTNREMPSAFARMFRPAERERAV